jgi:hypothetical protein
MPHLIGFPTPAQRSSSGTPYMGRGIRCLDAAMPLPQPRGRGLEDSRPRQGLVVGRCSGLVVGRCCRRLLGPGLGPDLAWCLRWRSPRGCLILTPALLPLLGRGGWGRRLGCGLLALLHGLLAWAIRLLRLQVLLTRLFSLLPPCRRHLSCPTRQGSQGSLHRPPLQELFDRVSASPHPRLVLLLPLLQELQLLEDLELVDALIRGMQLGPWTVVKEASAVPRLVRGGQPGEVLLLAQEAAGGVGGRGRGGGRMCAAVGILDWNQ